MFKSVLNYFALGLLLFAFFSIVGSLSFASTAFANDINENLNAQSNVQQQIMDNCGTECHFNTLSSNMSKNMEINENILSIQSSDDGQQESMAENSLAKDIDANTENTDNKDAIPANPKLETNLEKSAGEVLPKTNSAKLAEPQIKNFNSLSPVITAGKVTIYGEASIEISPDKAKVSVCIESIDANKKESRAKAQEKFNTVVSALTQAGVSKDSIVLSSFYTHESLDCRNLVGFVSNVYLNFEANTNDVTSLVSNLVENDGVEITGVTYFLSDYDKIYNGLLSTAVQNAVAKAELLNSSELQVTNIEEECTYCPTLWRNSAEVLDSNGYTGKIEVTAKVKVTLTEATSLN